MPGPYVHQSKRNRHKPVCAVRPTCANAITKADSSSELRLCDSRGVLRDDLCSSPGTAVWPARRRQRVPNAVARVVHRCWTEIPSHSPSVEVDAFVLMPNHLHGVLLLGDGAHPLPTVVGSFKSAVSRETGLPVWQRSYYERVIRSEAELEAIRHYILQNPLALPSGREIPVRSGTPASAPWL